MAIDNCGLSCNVSDTVVTYSPIPGSAPLWDEGDVVSFEVDQIDLMEHTDHTGTLVIRTGKNVKWVEITLTLFPCSEWYSNLYNAWCANTLICGDLVIDDPCCSRKFYRNVSVKKMGIKPISHNSSPIEVIFRGIVVCDN